MTPPLRRKPGEASGMTQLLYRTSHEGALNICAVSLAIPRRRDYPRPCGTG